MKKIISCLLTIVLAFPFSTVYAEGYSWDSMNSNMPIFVVKVTDNETNAVRLIELSDDVVSQKPVITRNNTDGEVRREISFSGDIPLFADTSTIKPCSDIQTNKDEAFVRANLKITYTVKPSQEEIRVEAVSGSWTQASSSFTMTFSDRQVMVADGVPLGRKNWYYPSSNSFYYSTGWGYVIKYPSSSSAYTGAGGFSSVVAAISGMGGSHTIEVTLLVP